jgi:uncharacterized protein
MTEDLMRYDLMAQRALRGVVRLALEQAGSDEGLPGEHHFYVAFDTRAAGVVVPEHLRNEYPEEMTIVFKRTYQELDIQQDAFSVTMFFHSLPQRLTVPFEAVTRFFDPIAKFGLAWPTPEPQAQEPHIQHSTPHEPGSAQVVSLDAFRKK